MRTNVPALGEEDAEEEADKEGAGADPSVDGEWRGLVEVGLEDLGELGRC